MYPKEISEAIEKKSFGLFVGAGLSIGANLPSWQEMLNDLITEIEEKSRVSDERINDLRTLVNDPSKYLLLAEEIREIIPTELEKYIRKKFDSSVFPTKTHELLVKIKSKFIITTNYDTLIETALVKNFGNYPRAYTYKDPSSISYNLWNDDFFVLKAHGDSRDSPSEIILTENDYRKIIFHQQGYQSVLHAIFSTNTLLFLGVSLSDPELLLLLSFIHNIFHGGSPMHYALIANKTLTDTEQERWRKDFNIQCVNYNPRNQHEELNEILASIIKETGERKTLQ